MKHDDHDNQARSPETYSRRERAVRTALAIAKFAVLLAFIIGIPTLIFLKYPHIIDEFKDIENVNALLEKYHTHSMFIYIGLQIIQILIAFLPGQALQFAAGYAFSFILALLLSLIGIAIGTVITFYLGRIFGKDMVYLVFGKEKLHRFVTLLNSKKAFVAVFLLYLFPGIPKDIFSYAAGISEFKVLPFTATSIVARTPALAVSLLVGSMLYTHNYTGIIIVSAVVVAIAVICAIKRKRVYAMVDSIYNRFIAKEGGDI
ncbi:MAG: VTT domain-containing protein [Clostridiales Family XIII bacterium]|jgi:uncharacterized membrane protein YdjX (TVP38/TMEM64 family)|nr:VTT domain-containing protein [Clostridiales Family XIII bacterium]